MTVPVCSRCDGWIETSNRKHPGYCSAYCRDKQHAEGNRKRAEVVERLSPRVRSR
mgnify:FL=1